MIDSESTLDQSLAGLCDVTRPRSELGLRIKGACRTERAGRRLSRRKRFVSTVLVLAAGGLLFLTMLRQMQHVAPEGWLRLGLGAAAGWAIALFSTLFAGLYQPPGRRGSRRLRGALAGVLLLSLFGYLGSLAQGPLALSSLLQRTFLIDVLRCGMSVTLGGAVIALGMLVWWRRTDPFDPGVSGALVGLLAGLTGVLALGEVCTSQNTWHLFIGHGLAVCLVTLFGLVLGRRWLAP